MVEALHFKDISEVSKLIRRGTISSEQLLFLTLDRIADLEPSLHAFLLVLGESALMQAREADDELSRGHDRGVLHGIPVGIKDIVDVIGVPTTVGADFRPNHIADADATVTARLRQAGAVIVGKLHMTEGAIQDQHPKYPRPVNPWQEDHWPGASSSGSAVAVAAGLCFAALGSDTGGSIRVPSFACGLSSIKPTWGLVSRHGTFPAAESFDHIGPMCRTVADAAAVLQVISGHDPRDTTTLTTPVPDYLDSLLAGVSGLRVGLDPQILKDRIDPEIAEATNAAALVLESLGARIREVTLPIDPDEIASIQPLMMAEMRLAHAEIYSQHAERYGEGIQAMFNVCDQFKAIDIARAVQARAVWCAKLNAMLSEVDVLILPGSPFPTPTWTELDAMRVDPLAAADRIVRYTFPFSASGSPTVSLPCGFTSTGMPMGIQLVGSHLSEALLTRVGHTFQKVTDFHTRHPQPTHII